MQRFWFVYFWFDVYCPCFAKSAVNKGLHELYSNFVMYLESGYIIFQFS